MTIETNPLDTTAEARTVGDERGVAAGPQGADAKPASPNAAYDEAYVEALRAEAAGHRTRLRELETLDAARRSEEAAARAAEASELEQLKARLADTEMRARALEVAEVRRHAAAAHGLSEELHAFVTAEDEAGALAQAEKLAAGVKAAHADAARLPPAGGRNPANGGEQAAKRNEQERFDSMRRSVPALNNRVLRDI